MKKFYDKNQIAFAISLIVLYVVGSSIMGSISDLAVTMFHAFLSVLLIAWCSKNKLSEDVGLCKPKIHARPMLFYVPLLFIASSSLWSGIEIKYGATEAALYVISMLFVGILEEVIFRGFLFSAMAKDSIKSAVIVSSVTFGIGHIINLLSGAELISTLCQIVCATAIGFLFVIVFIKTKSILPCIVAHSAVNMLSVVEANVEPKTTIIVSVLVSIVAIVSTIIYNKHIRPDTIKENDHN